MSTQALPSGPANRRPATHSRPRALAVAIAALLPLLAAPDAFAASTAALERRIAELERELDEARAELIETKEESEQAYRKAAAAEEQLAESGPPAADKITIGPLTIGGAIRANYILGSYPNGGNGPTRGGNGGTFALDTFRINLDLKYENLIGKVEYRWYPDPFAAGGSTYAGYSFLHTGWLGWEFDDGSQVQAGVNRVPFGPGPYGVSQSWFFDQHYYLGLSDDMDLGIKYITSLGNLDLDLAYYNRSEWNGQGTSLDSTRYSYDIVPWTYAVAPDGTVDFSAPPNGWEERNQFNLRAIYKFDDIAVPTQLGTSLQWGQLKGRRNRDGDHWAASVHMKNEWNNWLLATQLTRYKVNVHRDNPLNTDELVPMGAWNFGWPAATDAWIPAVSLSYLWETNRIPWLDSVRPYLEYSNIMKQNDNLNDSELWVLGAAWARGGWYIYTDLAYSNGNNFVGSENHLGLAEPYTNIYTADGGVGDWGAAGNNKWNYRFNINFGYYF
jgi:hypothetical protein